MKRAVPYLRVSTIEQTTANQERELREVASRMGREVIRVYNHIGSLAAFAVVRAGEASRPDRFILCSRFAALDGGFVVDLARGQGHVLAMAI
jgi:hypothetical protein